mmetsp:Transcript_11635/g.48742  ORF Transcript_11635/g.48742 Transcript_11635/m.48742 type:complete len:277 (+) Transcript_11635:1220-2050(+)
MPGKSTPPMRLACSRPGTRNASLWNARWRHCAKPARRTRRGRPRATPGSPGGSPSSSNPPRRLPSPPPRKNACTPNVTRRCRQTSRRAPSGASSSRPCARNCGTTSMRARDGSWRRRRSTTGSPTSPPPPRETRRWRLPGSEPSWRRPAATRRRCSPITWSSKPPRRGHPPPSRKPRRTETRPLRGLKPRNAAVPTPEARRRGSKRNLPGRRRRLTPWRLRSRSSARKRLTRSRSAGHSARRLHAWRLDPRRGPAPTTRTRSSWRCTPPRRRKRSR